MKTGKLSVQEFNQRIWEFTKGELIFSKFYDPLIGIDVIKMDDILHERFGYKESKHGSMYDFLKSYWSKEFADWFQSNMHNVMTVMDAYKPKAEVSNDT